MSSPSASLPTDFQPTRTEALRRLKAFLPRAGRDYARTRNYDHGPQDRGNVSVLSPYVRHRLVTEEEVVAAVLDRHGLGVAEKFVQEVIWRTYWKGWLEQRPETWSAYLATLAADRERFAADDALADALARAEAGATGITCFDAWVHELAATGYLHNHARMWFASIWIFTLRLPWTLGADLFMRHLLDGDPASNTLSWRWVAGLHTRGKTYLARPDNIATYTGGRFVPGAELARTALPLDDEATAPLRPIQAADPLPNEGAVALLLHEDDLAPESWGVVADVGAVATLAPAAPTLGASPAVLTFKRAALDDAARRASQQYRCRNLGEIADPAALAAHLNASGLARLVTMAAPVGPARAHLDALGASLRAHGIQIITARRPWDDAFWPHARAGFFGLKERIPAVLSRLGLIPEAAPARGKTRRRR